MRLDSRWQVGGDPLPGPLCSSFLPTRAVPEQSNPPSQEMALWGPGLGLGTLLLLGPRAPSVRTARASREVWGGVQA